MSCPLAQQTCVDQAVMNDSTASLDRLPARQLMRTNGPLYRQLADILRTPIADGSFPVGASLPEGSRDRRSLRHQPDHRPPGAPRARRRRPDPQALRQAGRGRRASATDAPRLEPQEFRRHRRLCRERGARHQELSPRDRRRPPPGSSAWPRTSGATACTPSSSPAGAPTPR